MEYENIEYGQRSFPVWKAGRIAREPRGRGGGERGALGCAAAAVPRGVLPARQPASALPLRASDGPFMNDMDEITYWVYTKRAPCLMNYDNLIKKQNELAQSSKQCKSERSTAEVPSPKKKKRKLSLLEDDPVSASKQKNVYFEASQNKQRTALSSCKSAILESDVDFNIKKSSVQEKPKKCKMQKNGRTLHKKNKVVTSTPLRRSLRKAQNCVNSNEQLNISCETFHCSLGDNIIQTQSKLRPKKTSTKAPGADRILNNKKEAVLPNKSTNETVLNGQFEDLSDVSGFTANYIRSTKIHSNSKPRRNLRSKSSRYLMRESQKHLQENGTTMLVCVNKSVNATTRAPNASVLNCSSDSSQNVINLITTKNTDKSIKVDRSTSLLKFVDARLPKVKASDSNIKVDHSKLINKHDMDNALENKNSRYPKRYKNHSTFDVTLSSACNLMTRTSQSKRKTPCKNVIELNSSHRKENPTDSSLSRTRSGRNLALTMRQPDNAVLVYSNSTEQVSSLNTMNVASQPAESIRVKPKNKRLSSHNKKSVDKSGVSFKDSVREKSGFAACFSDSDDGSEALKQRKFFC